MLYCNNISARDLQRNLIMSMTKCPSSGLARPVATPLPAYLIQELSTEHGSKTNNVDSFVPAGFATASAKFLVPASQVSTSAGFTPSDVRKEVFGSAQAMSQGNHDLLKEAAKLR